VVGKRVRVAKARLRARHCRSGKLTYRHVGVAKNGRVLKESPRAGTRMKNGAKVNLVVGHAARKT
jgi:beta-lactam-binding protein with PASTA domain